MEKFEWRKSGTYKWTKQMRFRKLRLVLHRLRNLFKEDIRYMSVIISQVHGVRLEESSIVEYRNELSPVNMCLGDTFMINFLDEREEIVSALQLSFIEEGRMVLRTYKQEIAQRRKELEKLLEPEWAKEVREKIHKCWGEHDFRPTESMGVVDERIYECKICGLNIVESLLEEPDKIPSCPGGKDYEERT